ncbi:P-II family nitrogen regulator [Neorhodopirellula pilleata]|uniref:Nitrogen regulatory protein P-II n=1 Tax=Neorhodopirellula pilleata TaxID=2714738 RepID=A0A5C6ARC0_9BACT|nr:P-II family nitrogen regulator [Neorhodopirellula pilleata]TWU01779.1 Nitrogen regulatory protein P-II [Neorhodopirellula pilleata]
MIMVQAIIQPIRLSTVRSALEEAGYSETMVSDATGYGRQRGQTAMFRGNEYRIDLLRKVILEVVIDEDDLDEVIEIIRASARTGTRGEIGDGKIFVLPVADAIPI